MTDLNAMADQPARPIVVAVVGHTNTGKTSLIRTLLRNAQFGKVADAAGTTRHVEAARILIADQPVLEMRDTPGLEDSLALQALLASVRQQGLQGRQCLQHLIDHREQHIEFEQEIKVLKQALECDALLYVVDCRDDFFEKYRQELLSLALAARPILPVLNFVNASNAQKDVWRDALADLQLHAVVEFDTVAFDFSAENRLYQKLQTLLEPFYDDLQMLIDQRASQWEGLRIACLEQVAELLIDVAQYTINIDAGTSDPAILKGMQDYVRQREKECLITILGLMQFSETDVALSELPVADGEWTLDLFSPATLKAFGVKTASAAATGAAIGAGVDLMLAGMSLGAATATGAAIGAAWNTSQQFGRNILAKIRGQVFVCVDDATMNILLLRQLALLDLLFHRGHAAQTRAGIAGHSARAVPAGWQQQLHNLRQLPPKNTEAGARMRANFKMWLNSLV